MADINKELETQMEFAWSRMGDTGADDYWESATKNEIFYYGYYIALEFVEKSVIKINYEKDGGK